MLHADGIERQQQRSRGAMARLDGAAERLLHTIDVLVHLLIVALVDDVRVEKAPSEELLHILAPDLAHRRVPEPPAQVRLRVGHGALALHEQGAALVTSVQGRVHSGPLARACERQVDEEEEEGLEREVPLQEGGQTQAV